MDCFRADGVLMAFIHGTLHEGSINRSFRQMQIPIPAPSSLLVLEVKQPAGRHVQSLKKRTLGSATRLNMMLYHILLPS